MSRLPFSSCDDAFELDDEDFLDDLPKKSQSGTNSATNSVHQVTRPENGEAKPGSQRSSQPTFRSKLAMFRLKSTANPDDKKVAEAEPLCTPPDETVLSQLDVPPSTSEQRTSFRSVFAKPSGSFSSATPPAGVRPDVEPSRGAMSNRKRRADNSFAGTSWGTQSEASNSPMLCTPPDQSVLGQEWSFARSTRESPIMCTPTDRSVISMMSQPVLHARNSPAPTSRIKGTIPGPAGLITTPVSSNNSVKQKLPCPQPSRVVLGESTLEQMILGPWSAMMSDLGLSQYSTNDPSCFLNVMNIYHISTPTDNQLVSTQKIPFLAVVLKSINASTPDPSAVFTDSTGDIQATVDHGVVEAHPNFLCPGSALLLKNPVVLTTGPMKRQLLIVTLQNLVAAYAAVGEQIKTLRLANVSLQDIQAVIGKSTYQVTHDHITSSTLERAMVGESAVMETEEDIISSTLEGIDHESLFGDF